MKKNIFTKGLAAILVAGSLASCSSDYLQLEPITSITSDKIASDVNAAQVTFNGICEAMYVQYSGWADFYFVMNGEPWISMFYGESYGCDDLTYVWGSLGVGPQILNWERMNIDDNWYCHGGWAYYYSLVGQCNQLLAVIDDCPTETDAEKAQVDYIKAGCLTVRSHAFTRLLQIYGPRWEDSNNGTKDAIVLRLEPTYTSIPLSSMGDVKTQVYKDLDEAIALYDACGVRRSVIWEPDGSVARGIYARLAMVVNDYEKAQEMASEARKGYPIMTAEEYCDGFCYENNEWMWANPYDNYLYYWAHGSIFGCNGAYPIQWGNIGAGAMNLDLYRQMDKKDIRRTLYIMPDQLVARTVKESSFWTNSNYCDEATCNINLTTLNPTCQQKLDKMLANKPASLSASAPDAYSFGSSGRTGITIPMGAHLKFWGGDDFGTNQFPYMRAAEMLLIEAEAACHNGQEAVAKSCLTELNSKRGLTSFSTSNSGAALLDEVRMYSRVELWGEGHCWYNFKRWNIPMERRGYVFDDPTSNNFPIDYEKYFPTDYRNGWRFAIPRNETQFNDMIEKNQTAEMAQKPRK